MKDIYAVIDTNVIISAPLTDKTDVATVKIIDFIANGKIKVVSHNEILEEYKRVLLYDKFHFSKKRINAVLDFFKKKSIFFDRTPTNEKYKHPDDAVFYEVTLTAKDKFDDAYLVTGNGRHFPIKPFVVKPAEMVAIVGEKLS